MEKFIFAIKEDLSYELFDTEKNASKQKCEYIYIKEEFFRKDYDEYFPKIIFKHQLLNRKLESINVINGEFSLNIENDVFEKRTATLGINNEICVSNYIENKVEPCTKFQIIHSSGKLRLFYLKTPTNIKFPIIIPILKFMKSVGEFESWQAYDLASELIQTQKKLAHANELIEDLRNKIDQNIVK